MNRTPLIAPNEFAERLHDPRWIAVDCRFVLTAPDAGRVQYLESHIAGARYADLDRDLAREPAAAEGRHPLPEPAVFAARLGELGIGNDSTVVAYDEGPGAIAARLWWMLRWLGHDAVRVLDGGFAAWTAAGLPTRSGEESWQPAEFLPSRIATDAVVATGDIAGRQAAGALLVDARGAARYRGEQEPIDPVAGHVPGALNRPFTANMAADGRFKAPDALRRELSELLGGRASSDLIAMCGSGVTACHTLLAFEVAGLPGGRLYAGSWSEWIRDPARPVAKGSAP